ncbi:MAG: ADP-ribosylation factor-like protein [Candidatus Thorarchaeota archaeon]
MIFSTILLNAKNKRKIVSSEYWTKSIPRKVINQYLAKLETLTEKSEQLKYKPMTIGDYKFISRACGEKGIILFVADNDEPDEEVINKINRTASSLRTVLDNQTRKYISENYEQLVARFVQSQFVIALVGTIGVGKTSLLHLLMGTPPPESHTPTIAVNIEILDDIRFANYEIVVFDFSGREVAGKLWDLSSTDIVFLLTDSTLKNIISSKSISTEILAAYPEIPIVLFANKQDTSNALDPSAISKVMGLVSHPMVAIDLAYRENLLKVLVDVLSDYFDLDVPDLPVAQLLCTEKEA